MDDTAQFIHGRVGARALFPSKQLPQRVLSVVVSIEFVLVCPHGLQRFPGFGLRRFLSVSVEWCILYAVGQDVVVYLGKVVCRVGISVNGAF